MAPKILITLIIAALLTACAPSEEDINANMDEFWNQMSAQEKSDICDAYMLFGPTDLERMLNDSLADDAEELGMSPEVAQRENARLVSKAGEECL